MLPPEVQKQLQEQKKQCVFCKIVSKEIDSNIIFEDKETLAFLDIFPLRKGHTLFIPKEHAPLPLYLSEAQQKQYYGLLPQLVGAMQKSLVHLAFSLFQANGGGAGQAVPHTALHLLPRDSEDGFFQFFWKQKAKNDPLLLQQKLAAAIPGIKPFPQDKGVVLYEDTTLQLLVPSPGLVSGHVQLISKEKEFSTLSPEKVFRLFSLANLVAGIIFQVYQAQGTNIIVKCGRTDDHPEGGMTMHIIPRQEEDGLQLWQQKQEQPSYDLKGVAGRIKEGLWKVKYVPVKDQPEKGVAPVAPSLAKKPLLRSSVEEEIWTAVEMQRNASKRGS